MAGMSRSSVHEFAAVLRQRYQVASRAERKVILDEFLAVSSYHRKSAIRLFGLRIASKPKMELGKRRGRPRQYAPAVAAALQVLWESCDCICSRRLQPFVPKLLDALRRHFGVIRVGVVDRRRLAGLHRRGERGSAVGVGFRVVGLGVPGDEVGEIGHGKG